MVKSGLPKSVRKFIRLQKSLIRRQVLDYKKQEEMIGELYKKFMVKQEIENAFVGNQKIETTLISKSKILNPKQIQNSKNKNTKSKRTIKPKKT